MKKVAIIGSGYTGLGCAHYLRNSGIKVKIFEAGNKVAGLASGFKMHEWQWPIEKYIHHWFTNDQHVIDIAKDLGVSNKLIVKNTKSSSFYDGKIAQLDSPMSVIKFPFLSLKNRVRMGAAAFAIKNKKDFIKFENETAFSFIRRTMGQEALDVVWAPLFYGKFGKHAEEINAAWFCGRIYARTKDLMYFAGGFQDFAEEMSKSIKKSGQEIVLNTKVKKIIKAKKGFYVQYGKKKEKFDYVVLTVPLSIALQLYDFPVDFKEKYSKNHAIGAQYFVLELEKPFLPDNVYWLNINEKSFPFMLVAEHTNFVNKRFYDGKHMIWVGKYLDYDDPLWSLNEEQLYKKILPYLKKINPEFNEQWVKRRFFSRDANAQPIMKVNHSMKVPPISTPVDGLFLANMHHIYPFDRATNPALGVGKQVAGRIRKDSKVA